MHLNPRLHSHLNTAEEMVAKRLAHVQALQLALKPVLQFLMNKSKMLPTEEETFDESDIIVARVCVAVENCFFDGLKVGIMK